MVNFNYEEMEDAQLKETYLTLKNALNECGFSENLVKEYVRCANEIVLRYFDEQNLIDRSARRKLIDSVLNNATSS